MSKTTIYLDYHATTPVDPLVFEAMLPFFTEHFGNTASLQHKFGWMAKEAVTNARKNIAGAINALPQEIIFTSGATESNNLALKGLAGAYRTKGNHIITSAIEHPCVINTCKWLEHQGFSVTYLPVNKEGKIDIVSLKNEIRDTTIIISIMAANNEIGTIQDLQNIGSLCAEKGILFHTDATQAVGKIPIDVKQMNISALSLSAHKIYGPKGIGMMYLRSKNPRLHLESQIHGGGHEHGLRSGTLNVPGIVGFGKAVTLAMESMNEENARVLKLRDHLIAGLTEIEDVHLNGDKTDRLSNNVNVTIHGVSADMLMNEVRDIALSSGSACTTENTEANVSHVLRAIGLSDEEGRSTLRFGLGRYTTEEEIQYTIQSMRIAIQKMRKYSQDGVTTC